MADVWDIARYVEIHPNDYAQRWRLAKKLYMACEYRAALEHLQILKKEWTPKVSVARYLAATQFRLGRYDEATTSLQESIDMWPEELALYEQWARVLEAAGRREEAGEIWEQVKKLNPNHPFAERAMRRLWDQPARSPEQDLNLGDSDSGITLHSGWICRNCGAQNSREFDRCWQCHASKTGIPTPTPTPRPARRSLPEPKPRPWALTGGFAIVALLSIGVYLTVMYLPMVRLGPRGLSIEDGLSTGLIITRMVAGAVLLIVWPLALHLGLRWVKGKAFSRA